MREERFKGYELPPIIHGAWQLSGGHGNASQADATLRSLLEREAEEVIAIDCADIYTGVEERLGELTGQLGPRLRQKIRVHTKFVPDLAVLAELDERYVRRIVTRSLKRLRREALDLVQLHWWDFATPGHVEAALVLEKLRCEGKILNIGVTNYGTKQLKQLVDAGVPVVSDQIQFSLLDRRPHKSLCAYAAENDVKLLCYGSLAGGFLSDRYVDQPEPREPYSNRSLVKYKLIVDECGGWSRLQGLLRALQELAHERGCRICDLATAYVLTQPAVHSVIVGLSTRGASQPILQGIAPSEGEEQRIHAVLASLCDVPGEVYEVERNREGKHGSIMRYNLNEISA